MSTRVTSLMKMPTMFRKMTKMRKASRRETTTSSSSSSSPDDDDDDDDEDDDDDDDEDDGADEDEDQDEVGTKTLVKPATTVQAESKTEARGTVHATFQGKTDSQIKTSVKQKPATQGISPAKTVPKQELSVKPEAKVQAILQEKAESEKTGKMNQNRVEEKKDAGRHAKANASNADTDPKKNEAPIADAKNKEKAEKGTKTVDGGLLGVFKAFNNKM